MAPSQQKDLEQSGSDDMNTSSSAADQQQNANSTQNQETSTASAAKKQKSLKKAFMLYERKNINASLENQMLRYIMDRNKPVMGPNYVPNSDVPDPVHHAHAPAHVNEIYQRMLKKTNISTNRNAFFTKVQILREFRVTVPEYTSGTWDVDRVITTMYLYKFHTELMGIPISFCKVRVYTDRNPIDYAEIYIPVHVEFELVVFTPRPGHVGVGVYEESRIASKTDDDHSSFCRGYCQVVQRPDTIHINWNNLLLVNLVLQSDRQQRWWDENNPQVGNGVWFRITKISTMRVKNHNIISVHGVPIYAMPLETELNWNLTPALIEDQERHAEKYKKTEDEGLDTAENLFGFSESEDEEKEEILPQQLAEEEAKKEQNVAKEKKFYPNNNDDDIDAIDTKPQDESDTSSSNVSMVDSSSDSSSSSSDASKKEVFAGEQLDRLSSRNTDGKKKTKKRKKLSKESKSDDSSSSSSSSSEEEKSKTSKKKRGKKRRRSASPSKSRKAAKKA